LQLEKAGIVTVVFYVQILYNFCMDVLVFHYSFTLRQILGGVLILATNLFTSLSKIH